MKFSFFFKGIFGLCLGIFTTQTYAQYITMKPTCSSAGSGNYRLQVDIKAMAYATVSCDTYRSSYNTATAKYFSAAAVRNTIFLNNFGSGSFALNFAKEANGINPISNNTLFFTNSVCSIMWFDGYGYYYEYVDYESSFARCT